MPKYIDKDKIKFIEYVNGDVTVSKEEIEKMQEEDVAPVVHARWELECEPDGTPYCFHCSHCDEDWHCIKISEASNYCPDCGAKMDLEIKFVAMCDRNVSIDEE